MKWSKSKPKQRNTEETTKHKRTLSGCRCCCSKCARKKTSLNYIFALRSFYLHTHMYTQFSVDLVGISFKKSNFVVFFSSWIASIPPISSRAEISVKLITSNRSMQQNSENRNCLLHIWRKSISRLAAYLTLTISNERVSACLCREKINRNRKII